MKSKLIVMLTNNDQTVSTAFEDFESCKDLNVDYWGFKDVGLSIDKMKRLVSKIKEEQKTTFLEIVSYTEEECLKGAILAVECGFDYLLGTIFYNSVWEYLKDKPIKYMPFVGRVSGSPSILQGTIENILEESMKLEKFGIFGFDLLGYRHDVSPEFVSEQFIKNVKSPVVLAGSIGSKERIDSVNKFNPWCFTMGSALYRKKFVKHGSFRDNLEVVLSYMESL